MRHSLILVALLLVLVVGAAADTLKLLDGRIIIGTFLGGDARTLRMEVNNEIAMFPISEVESLSFGTAAAGVPAAPTVDPKQAREQEKARKKAEEQAAKAARQAEKAQKAAAEASAKAAQAAARVQGAAAAAKAPTEAPRFGRFGKPAALGQANDTARAAAAAPAALGSAAQSAVRAPDTVQQAAAVANQAASVAADPGTAASAAAQQAGQRAVSSVTSPVAPVAANAQAAVSTARTISDRAAAARAQAGAAQTAATTEEAPPSEPPSTRPAPPAAPPDGTPAAPAVPAAAEAQPRSSSTPGSPAPDVSPLGVTEPPRPSANVMTPHGLVFRVRMVEAINTDVHKPGEVFRASLEAPLSAGAIAAPRGADVMLRLVRLAAARGANTPLYSLEAISLRVDSRNVPFVAQLTWQPGDTLPASRDVRSGDIFHGTEALKIPSDGLLSFRVPSAVIKR